MIQTYKPFLVALKAPSLELLDGHNHTTSWPRGAQSVRIDPPFEDKPESSLPDKIIRAEVPGGILELAQAEGFESVGDKRADSQIIKRIVLLTCLSLLLSRRI